MSLLIELKTEDIILELIDKYPTMVLIGCTECANISLSYNKGYSLASRVYNEGITTWKPHAILHELKRLKEVIENEDKIVHIEVDQPCLLTDDKDFFMANMRTDIHAILLIGCVAGKVGIEKTIGNAIPVLLAANTIGIIQYHIYIKTAS